jgi:hypothetical protein
LFLRRARAHARAVLRELPGSGDDLRSTHSVSLSPARTGAVSVLRLFSGVTRMQSVRGRLAGSRAVRCDRSPRHRWAREHLQQLWSFIGHPARLSAPPLHAQYHAFLIGPRGLRNGTRYHRLGFAPALSADFLTMATPPTIFLCVVLLLCILVTGR